jgi:DNA modification methylase
VSTSVLQGDARRLPLPDASVDLIVTSPPYWQQRDYGVEGQIGQEAAPAEYVAALLECTREWMRVLKPEGSIFVNLGDKYDAGKSLMYLPERYRIACRDELALIGRAVIIWGKTNGQPDANARDRARRSHEEWVHLTKSGRYYSAVDEIRVPYAASSVARSHLTQTGSATDERRVAARNKSSRYKPTPYAASPLGKLPGSVWEIATQPLRIPDHVAHAVCCAGAKREDCKDGIDHQAAYPMEWPRRLILGWSPPGGVVLDPFGGAGTTALVADTLGRHGISADLSDSYCRLASWRVNDPAERARASDIQKPPPVADGQGDLFEAAS